LNTPTIAVTLDEAGMKVTAIVPAGVVIVLVEDMPGRLWTHAGGMIRQHVPDVFRGPENAR
jgi:hypothetical protein